MGVDPPSPQMTFLLVMLHAGTMGAVLVYFWPRWESRLLDADAAARRRTVLALLWATAATGAVGLLLQRVIERVLLKGQPSHEIESLFSNLRLMAAGLFAAGCLILAAAARSLDKSRDENLAAKSALWIGAVQGLCLPFRGFSRSGATISTALLNRVPRGLSEDFSFALAVILTPPVILKEAHRLSRASSGSYPFAQGVVGMAFSFIAGYLALKLLSRWLEGGKWRYFGWYCIAASAGVLAARRFLP